MSDTVIPEVIISSSEFNDFSKKIKMQGKSVALVPTMGALHEGHLSLVSKANEIADRTVVSIFVNPTQFGENEDFNKYARDLDGDIAKLSDYRVDAVFAPVPEEIYPEGYSTYVEVKDLDQCMCGLYRPGHFKGVATVVLKLFNIVMPDYAVFGRKDYQQLKIIEKMVSDLNLNIEIVEMPVVREKDGLALSSRNKYLSDDERVRALSLSRALTVIKKSFDDGLEDTGELVELGKRILSDGGIMDIDYLDIRDSKDLSLIKKAESGNLVALAVRIGETRLIDNMML